MRIKDKWYKELWWKIIELLTPNNLPRPMTKEARKNMKKVHKEKGKYGV